MGSTRWRSWFAALTVFAAVGAAPVEPRATQPRPPDVEALLTRLDDLYRSKSSIARMEIHVVGSRAIPSLRQKAGTPGEEETRIVIEAPPRSASARISGTTCRASHAPSVCLPP